MLAPTLNDNRRAAYRVRPIATDDLKLRINWMDRRFLPLEVADVTRHGAGVRFARGAGPRVSKGERVAVEVESPNLRGCVTMPARVVFSGERETESLLGLSFTDSDGLDERASEDFFQLFNRRRAYRDAEAGLASTLAATVKPLESAHSNNLFFPVAVRNVSATGICLDVAVEADRFLHARSQIRLALTLPGRHAPCDIATTVRYRSAIDEKIYYGCHFDWSETEQAPSILEALTGYTHNRFEQQLAELSH